MLLSTAGDHQCVRSNLRNPLAYSSALPGNFAGKLWQAQDILWCEQKSVFLRSKSHLVRRYFAILSGERLLSGSSGSLSYWCGWGISGNCCWCGGGGGGGFAWESQLWTWLILVYRIVDHTYTHVQKHTHAYARTLCYVKVLIVRKSVFLLYVLEILCHFFNVNWWRAHLWEGWCGCCVREALVLTSFINVHCS